MKKETMKFRAIFFLLWSLDIMIYYFPMFFNQATLNLGWNASMTSAILSASPFAGALGMFIVSFFTGNEKKNINILKITISTVLVLFSILLTLGYTVPKGATINGSTIVITDKVAYYGLYLGFFLISVLCSAFLWGSYSLANGTGADVCRLEKSTYASITMFSSIAYILIAPLGGLLVQTTGAAGYKGYLVMFAMAIPIAILLLILLFLVKPYDTDKLIKDEGNQEFKMKELFKNKQYIILLLVCTLIMSSVWASDSLNSKMWTSLQAVDPSTHKVINAFSPLMWGVLVSCMSFAELIGCLIYNRLYKHFNNKTLFLTAVGLLVVRTMTFGVLSYFFVNSSDLGSSAGYGLASSLILVNMIRGGAKGLYSSTSVPILIDIVGPKLKSKALFLGPICIQLLNGVLQFIYPLVINLDGGIYRYLMYFLYAFIALVAFVLTFVFLNKSKRKEISE